MRNDEAPDKARLRREVDAAAARREDAADIVLDRARSAESRLRAARALVPVGEEAVALQLMELVFDRNEPAELRAAVLESQTNVVLGSGELIEALIASVRAPGEPIVFRRAALRVLEAAAFSSRELANRKAEFVDALRSLIAEDDDELRRNAMQDLALEADEVVQRELVRGLRGETRARVEPEVAIQFLSYDQHANVFPLLREIAMNPPNLRSKKEALRNLAGDPESADLLAQVVDDTREDPEVRHIAALSLAESQPSRARDAARRVVLDRKEDPELRTAMLNSIVHLGALPGADDQSFAEELAVMPKRNLPQEFRNVYERFLKSKRRPNR
jgi:hypothetical protein